jgi:hypothetical protein
MTRFNLLRSDRAGPQMQTFTSSERERFTPKFAGSWLGTRHSKRTKCNRTHILDSRFYRNVQITAIDFPDSFAADRA